MFNGPKTSQISLRKVAEVLRNRVVNEVMCVGKFRCPREGPSTDHNAVWCWSLPFESSSYKIEINIKHYCDFDSEFNAYFFVVVNYTYLFLYPMILNCNKRMELRILVVASAQHSLRNHCCRWQSLDQKTFSITLFSD